MLSSPSESANTPIVALRFSFSFPVGPASRFLSSLIASSVSFNSFSNLVTFSSKPAALESYCSTTSRSLVTWRCSAFTEERYVSRDARDLTVRARAFSVHFCFERSSTSRGDVVGMGGGVMVEMVTSWIVAAPRPSTLHELNRKQAARFRYSMLEKLEIKFNAPQRILVHHSR